MRDYIQLLLWILFLYFWSWFYTGWRTESALITVNRKFSKVFFYIKSFHEISIVSIIMGLFAHFSLIFFLVLVCANHAVAPYMSLIVRIWIWLGISLGVAGETIETYIKMKRAEAVSKKREFLILTILLTFVTGFMICMTVRCSLLVNTIQRETESENHRAAVWNNTRIDVMNEIVDIEAVDINLEAKKVLIVEDKEVRDNNTFVSFINKEIAAYDSEEKAYQYIYEYFSDYGEIFGIHYMAEDLNLDGKRELLMILMYAPDQGDLYVFHESNGSLYAWEVLEDFFTMRIGEVYLLENGTFEFFGGYGQGHFFKQYNENGEIEDVLNYYYNSYPYEGKIRYDYALTIYEQGVSARELQYSIIAPADKTPDEGELLSGTREVQEECNHILDEFFAESERVRWFKLPQNEDGEY